MTTIANHPQQSMEVEEWVEKAWEFESGSSASDWRHAFFEHKHLQPITMNHVEYRKRNVFGSAIVSLKPFLSVRFRFYPVGEMEGVFESEETLDAFVGLLSDLPTEDSALVVCLSGKAPCTCIPPNRTKLEPRFLCSLERVKRITSLFVGLHHDLSGKDNGDAFAELFKSDNLRIIGITALFDKEFFDRFSTAIGILSGLMMLSFHLNAGPLLPLIKALHASRDMLGSLTLPFCTVAEKEVLSILSSQFPALKELDFQADLDLLT